MKPYLERGYVAIENVRPLLDCGRCRPKAIVGDEVTVAADLFRDGPDLLRAVVRWRVVGAKGRWRESPMTQVGNDAWEASFTPDRVGRWSFTIQAWTDRFSTWRRYLERRVEAGQEIDLELEEGARLLEECLEAAPTRSRERIAAAIRSIRAAPVKTRGKRGEDPRVVAALDPKVHELAVRLQPRRGASVHDPPVELLVERERARFGAWYEFFPRSTGTATKHGTFDTAIPELTRIARMGFDVVYLPPIHPIGHTYRKGKNNALERKPNDVGSPWAIGAEEGGHDAVHPDLGTIDDFDGFVKEAEQLGLEVALDFAIQCSPDHPWVKQHPEWFHHRPDGTIKYAENPPKKYQDVYPVNFDTENKTELWLELKRVVDFWITHGVHTFRVDNPHTKPLAFWEWLIESVHEEHPDVIFLAEAFTRPKVMKGLAKLGFSQSYTYFTWRNTKQELTEYLSELAHTDSVDYFRPNFFVNTPDILHEYLQIGGPPAFKIRFVLAAMLSPSYGLYSGYELFENEPREKGSEEYLHSEKFELKPRNWNRKPNLIGFITRINEIRRRFPSLHRLDNLHFHYVDKERMIAFSKSHPGQETVLVVVNLNPFHWEEATIHLDLGALGLDPYKPYRVSDLITDVAFTWRGPSNYVRLDPFDEPAHIFHVQDQGSAR
ncbi:MAG: alpha-1,4-glucan--maltose-1-phosphate maltosyltransferase [Actinomycetota bacterium]